MVCILAEMKYFLDTVNINLYKVYLIYLLLKMFDIWDHNSGQRTNGYRPTLGGKNSGKKDKPV